MINAILLPGLVPWDKYHSPERDRGFFPWLKEGLDQRGITTCVPEMPEPYAPHYEAWCGEIAKYEITEETILLGHSAGGGFWLRFLSERPETSIKKLILVAPSIDPLKKWDKEGRLFNFDEHHRIDPDLLQRCAQGIVLLFSSDDKTGTRESVPIIRSAMPGITLHEFSDKGHFTVREAPEVLNEFPQAPLSG